MTPFHLAFPVTNLELIKDFYTLVLKCRLGRESSRWIDFDFYGHQITAHLDESINNSIAYNEVDNQSIPARHFGVILEWQEWDDLLENIKVFDVPFYVQPYTRFQDQVGEQRTFFIQDPSNNFLEFKCFKDKQYIFKKT